MPSVHVCLVKRTKLHACDLKHDGTNNRIYVIHFIIRHMPHSQRSEMQYKNHISIRRFSLLQKMHNGTIYFCTCPALDLCKEALVVSNYMYCKLLATCTAAYYMY